MATTFLKPRWAAWENICLKKAFAQKIQHKIMAMALDRTIPSINKKIQKLGLRLPSAIRGRVKGQKQLISTNEKTPQDLSKMTTILRDYAPLEFFQKAKLSLQKGQWAPSQNLLLHPRDKSKWKSRMEFSDVGFTFVQPMDFLPSKEVSPSRKGEQKFCSEPAYVSLNHVEQWASIEGFHKLKGSLEKSGLSYWKNGTYFSRTQLLMHVNRLRYDHNLHPLVLIEEEQDLLA